jgi:hypothetical protein
MPLGKQGWGLKRVGRSVFVNGNAFYFALTAKALPRLGKGQIFLTNLLKYQIRGKTFPNMAVWVTTKIAVLRDFL